MRRSASPCRPPGRSSWAWPAASLALAPLTGCAPRSCPPTACCSIGWSRWSTTAWCCESELDTADARDRGATAGAECRAAAGGGAAPAGARPAGAGGDPAAARRSRRHQGVRRAGQRGAGRHRQAAESHARAAARRNWRPTASTIRSTASSSGARLRARSCASATSCSASSSRRASWINTWNTRRRPPSAANEYNVAHILIAVRAGRQARAAGAGQQAGARDRRPRPQRRGIRRARGHLFTERERAGRRRARLAQGYRAADLPGGCGRRA